MDRRHFVQSLSGGAAASTGALRRFDSELTTPRTDSSEALSPSKTFSYVTISKDTTGLVEMPVGIVEGGEGPTLTVTGGLMGTEYCGIEAASRIFKQTQPETLKGKLVVVPVVNLSSFQFRTPWFDLQNSVTPQDGKHINQHFPGVPDGTVTAKKMRVMNTLISATCSKCETYSDKEIASAENDVKDKTELDALVAYLQELGTAIKARR